MEKSILEEERVAVCSRRSGCGWSRAGRKTKAADEGLVGHRDTPLYSKSGTWGGCEHEVVVNMGWL